MRSFYLNVGCGGKRLPGFINFDLGPGGDLQVDVREGLPFPSQSVAGIFCEHFIEHLTQVEGVMFLRECRRVLVAGGRLRISTPDLDEMLRDYSKPNWLNQEWLNYGYDWVTTRCEMLNLGLREWGHKWVYNEEELNRLAGEVGLTLIKRCEKGVSEDPMFCDREYRGGNTMIVEYVRVLPASGDEVPLVSILIPAYRPAYFRAALESALQQTYPRTEIVVGDDSPTGEIGAIVSEYQARHAALTVIPGRVGPAENHLRCLAQARGEYVKFLNDDDVLHPDCVRHLADCLQGYPSVTLVTSHRQCIDAEGQPLPDIPPTRRPVYADSWLDGISAINVMLSNDLNFLGEPTTVMFRRREAQAITPSIFHLAGRRAAIGDQALWANLLSRGDAIYLVDTLSYYRLHADQQQRGPEFKEAVEAGPKQFRFDAARLGFLNSRDSARLLIRPLSTRPWWSEQIKEWALAADAQAAHGAFVPALELRRRALAEAPDDAKLIVDYGCLLMQAGEIEAARREFVKATVLAPEYAPGHVQVARVLVQLGNIPKARQAIYRALTLAAPDQEMADLLKTLYAPFQKADFALSDQSLFGWLNQPGDGQRITGECHGYGWVLKTGEEEAHILFFIDDVLLPVFLKRGPWAEVVSQFPYLAAANPQPGFGMQLNARAFPEGAHKLSCLAVTAKEARLIGQITIYTGDSHREEALSPTPPRPVVAAGAVSSTGQPTLSLPDSSKLVEARPPAARPNEVIRLIAPDDDMYHKDDTHYFSVGVSALHNVNVALQAAGRKDCATILDFPCGFGRVLRHLRAQFPAAQVTACDLNRRAVDFCAETFGAEAFYSDINPERLVLDRRYDLIWCGSLLTHLSQTPWLRFLRFFSEHLVDGGVLVFTTHGRLSARLIHGGFGYGLNPATLPALLGSYFDKGFAYQDYPGESGYGITLSSTAWVATQIQKMPNLRLLLLHEGGWDHHQDVVACIQEPGFYPADIGAAYGR